MLIDTHCHLTDERLSGDAEKIIENFGADGLECAITVGYDRLSSDGCVALADAHRAVYAAVGVHPHDAQYLTDDDIDAFGAYAENKKVVAIGEIGLDYYYDLSPREVQIQAFYRQIEFAHSVKLPVILHVRDAYEDAARILADCKSMLTRGVLLHCYSGSREMMREFDKYDAYYSFGGAITFKNARKNVESLAAVRSERFVLETDCPYMTPVPYRGKTNYPSYVALVAEKAAEVRGISEEEIAAITSNNAKRLFNRII